MSTFAEYRNWLVVQAATGFCTAAVAGKLLADLGCVVARLEPRADSPGAEPFDAAVHALVDSGKHSVCLDLGGGGAPALDALLRNAEVLVVDREHLKALERALGDLRQRFPHLTICACTPFGLSGPLSDWIGGEEIVQAMAGIMSITGHMDSGPARIAGAPLTHAAAMYAVSSIIADALRKRSGGSASLLDIAVYDAALAFQSAALPAYWLSGEAPKPIGNRHSMAAPWNSFRCSDGWVIICAGNHPTWARLCEAIGRPDLLADTRYATQASRVRHVETLEAEITAWTCERSVAEVEGFLNANSVAAGCVLPLHDVVRHPQFQMRGLATADGQQSGGVFHLDREPLDVQKSPWQRGSATRSILLSRCQVRATEYERWLAAGIIGEAPGSTDAKAA